MEKLLASRQVTRVWNVWPHTLLQKHLDEGSIPTVIFGGKRQFIERCKGNITREEWREVRSNRYLSRGDKTKGGNLNTRF